MSKNNIFFILHRPQLSENIGACARAIKNFDFKKLILINPKPIFPNDKILATSVGAKDIIKQSKNYDSLEKAISKLRKGINELNREGRERLIQSYEIPSSKTAEVKFCSYPIGDDNKCQPVLIEKLFSGLNQE